MKKMVTRNMLVSGQDRLVDFLVEDDFVKVAEQEKKLTDDEIDALNNWLTFGKMQILEQSLAVKNEN